MKLNQCGHVFRAILNNVLISLISAKGIPAGFTACEWRGQDFRTLH